LKRYLYLLLPVMMVLIMSCATSSELKNVRTELNREVEDKIAALDIRMRMMQEEQKQAIETMRKGQANTSADMSELREQIQQLRGQVEALQKGAFPDARGDSAYNKRLEQLAQKINFIENFLEISKKDSYGGTDGGISPQDSSSSDKQSKASQYAAAYQLFKNGNYTKAREAFQSFLTAYPTGEYSDNAQFWIGECYFFEKQYEKAILEYDNVTKKFPSSNKVPHALLKQGLSFLSLGDKASARLLLQQIIKDYPNTNQAKAARAKLQQIK
jgi:tol-pal system protein YbgF